jgi:hypothetical protein
MAVAFVIVDKEGVLGLQTLRQLQLGDDHPTGKNKDLRHQAIPK